MEKNQFDQTRPRSAELEISRIYRPGTKIEVVFDMDAEYPIVRSAHIHECDLPGARMIISQTNPEILPSLQAKKMNISTLVNLGENRKIRAGLDCRVLDFMKDYRLSNQKPVSAVRVAFVPESLQVVNVRSAYRFKPNEIFRVDIEIHLAGTVYASEQYCNIDNISFNGIGLVLPRMVNGNPNPLLELSIGQEVAIDLRLSNARAEDLEADMSCDVIVVRKEPDFTRRSGYAGMRLTGLSQWDVEKLNKFIHHAQLHEIQKSTG